MRKNVIVGLSIALGLYFIAVSVMGFTGAEAIVKTFDAIGIGQWFRYVTALCQLSGGGMLLMPRSRLYGALIVSGVLGGAVMARIFVLHASPIVAIGLLAIALSILWDAVAVKRAPTVV